MIVLICKLNIKNTLIARKNIVKIRKFKKLNNDFQNNFRKEQENIKIQ